MNKFNRAQEKWLRDLETTDAPQGTGALEYDGKFCCLGRACVVLKAKREQKGDHANYDGCSGTLPDSVCEKLKLYGNAGNLDDGNSLAEMNDSGRWSFKRIAAYVRRYPWKVFTNFKKPEKR